MICLENGLSVIEKRPYRERQKRTEYSKRDSFRTAICVAIDNCLEKKPKDFEDFLLLLEQVGYEIKRGKYTAVRGKRQKGLLDFVL